MYSLIYRFGTWLLQKLSVGGLIAVLGILIYGLWLFLQDNVDFDARRQARIEQLTAERGRLAELRSDIEERVGELRSEVARQEQRLQQANRVVATLRDLQNWWDRVFGNREQQQANAEQITRMEQLGAGVAEQLVELRGMILGAEGEREELEAALARTEDELVQAEESRFWLSYYTRLAWERAGTTIIIALLLYFFGPTVWKVTLYFGVAPLLARSRPIRFVEGVPVLPEVTQSRVSVEAALWPGEILHVREKYLQASDEGLAKQTRFLLDWRIPFTSLACGLSELVEMRNVMADGERRVTFSTFDDPHIELALIGIPEGSSLILRPSFLAGVITKADERLVIRRRWQLLRWQSWITLQFRFFEFHGPCRLLVLGIRGVRAERLITREGLDAPARRANSEATIGFTPSLDYRPVRAETFWGYYRGMNPLFDDHFSGHGLFVLQETSMSGSGGRPGNFWSSLWNGMLKIFGL